MSIYAAATELSVVEAKEKFREILPRYGNNDLDALVALSLLLSYQDVIVNADNTVTATPMTPAFIKKVVDLVQEAGANAWFSLIETFELPLENKARVKLVTSLAFGTSFRPDAQIDTADRLH